VSLSSGGTFLLHVRLVWLFIMWVVVGIVVCFGVGCCVVCVRAATVIVGASVFCSCFVMCCVVC
jgi:hypothetical protein